MLGLHGLVLGVSALDVDMDINMETGRVRMPSPGGIDVFGKDAFGINIFGIYVFRIDETR
jgi:hypothetical protein